MIKLIQGDCLEKMKDLEDNSVDAVVTDPPYELGFMGKKWDSMGIANNVEVWRECLRVLKPGGHLFSFGGTRTYHRMASVIEDAGFEIRDMVEWVYGSGFPKSHNIGKAIQKQEGVPLDDTGVISPISRPNVSEDLYKSGKVGKSFTIKNVTTENAKNWEGWGTALKPAHEPICMARKPISEKTIAENCLKCGTGGINIDGSRVEHNDPEKHTVRTAQRTGTALEMNTGKSEKWVEGTMASANPSGRFPANLIHDNSEEVRECFPETENGVAARFFKSIIYQAKASKAERNKGLDGLEEKVVKVTNMYEMVRDNGTMRELAKKKNNHPTVKPIALMEYLINMISRDNQVVLDPFMGSGTTGIACKRLNRNFIGIELDPEYFEIAKRRIKNEEIENE